MTIGVVGTSLLLDADSKTAVGIGAIGVAAAWAIGSIKTNLFLGPKAKKLVADALVFISVLAVLGSSANANKSTAAPGDLAYDLGAGHDDSLSR